MKNVLQKAAEESGRLLVKRFRERKHEIGYKSSHQDFYTQADIESQAMIKNIITEEMVKNGASPDEIGFIGEENLHAKSTKHLFIIDPLDGTTNFASGLDLFAISIAHCLNGEIIEGIIYRPTNNDLYFAKKGEGAYKNGKRLSISPVSDLKNSLLDGIISSRKDVYPKMFKILQRIFPTVKGFRSIFCMTLSDCFLADNIFNLTVNGNTFIWDIAVSKLLVEEAGGEMFDFYGNDVNLDIYDPAKAYQVISCHKNIKKKVLEYFK